jgi:magnesium transporter
MITTLVYRDTRLAAHNPSPDTLATLRHEPGVMLWVDLCGPSEEEIKLVLETTFGFHPLAIEDCVTDSPFPKFEEYEDYLYLVMHAVDDAQTQRFSTTEIDLFIGRNFLVSFHRKPLRPVQAAIDRCLRNPSTPVRGPDRFAHTLLDLMVEAYQPVLTALRRELEEIEEGVLRDMPAAQMFPRVAGLRKRFSALRQIVRPQREITASLSSGTIKLIRPVIVPYLRDLTEDLSRIETQASAWADQLILSFRVYLNKSNHEANTGIRVITAITALTIPVTLVSSWWGMNFERMPELSSRFGYLGAWALTLSGTVAILFYLRRRNWI